MTREYGILISGIASEFDPSVQRNESNRYLKSFDGRVTYDTMERKYGFEIEVEGVRKCRFPYIEKNADVILSRKKSKR